jgi:Arc/MetJ family transcription regulator
MTRMTVDVNDGWLAAAQQALGTTSTVATINEALRVQAMRVQGQEIAAAVASVQMDFRGSRDGFRYSGGRDLSSRADNATPKGSS